VTTPHPIAPDGARAGAGVAATIPWAFDDPPEEARR
jgi:hypothetical protein